MVDTINPNTNEPDVPDNRFYGGFDKPEETKINLADGQAQPTAASMEPVPSAPVEQQPVAPQPVAPQHPIADVAPVAPTEVKHTSYTNSADMINWRGVLVIAASGLLVTALVCVGIYFGVNAMNDTKLTEQQARLDNINKELTALKETPTPLTLPASETPPAEEAPVVVPVETPTETPVVVPSELVTPAGNG